MGTSVQSVASRDAAIVLVLIRVHVAAVPFAFRISWGRTFPLKTQIQAGLRGVGSRMAGVAQEPDYRPPPCFRGRRTETTDFDPPCWSEVGSQAPSLAGWDRRMGLPMGT